MEMGEVSSIELLEQMERVKREFVSMVRERDHVKAQCQVSAAFSNAPL